MVIIKDKILFSSLLVYILARLAFLFTSPYNTFIGEETKAASLGLDLLNGQLRLPFWGYMDSPHAGGTILTALLAVPFHLILGKIYLSLKLPSFVFSVAAFVLIARLLKENYGKSVYIPLALFFSLSTPHYIQKTVVNSGNSAELIFFTSVVLYLLSRVFARGHEGPGNFFALGLFSGFGLWVHYGQFSAILTLFVVWYLRDKLFFLRWKFIVLSFGFFIGFLPWLVYNAIYGFVSINSDRAFNNYCSIVGLKGLCGRFLDFILLYLPRSFHFLGFGVISAKVMAYALYVVICLSTLYIVWINRGMIISAFCAFVPLRRFNIPSVSFELILLIYFLVSISLLVSHNICIDMNGFWGSIEYRSESYILFLQPFIFTLCSISLARMRASGNKALCFTGGAAIGMTGVVLLASYLSLRPFRCFNDFMFKDMTRAGGINANAYECGFNYVLRPELCGRFLRLIHADLRDAFIQGAGVKCNYMIKDEKNWGVDKELFRTGLGFMNDDNKRVFFHNVLSGEESLPGDGVVEPAVIYQRLLPLVSVGRDKNLLDETYACHVNFILNKGCVCRGKARQ